MKKMENSFVVSGLVGKDASIHQFSHEENGKFFRSFWFCR